MRRPVLVAAAACLYCVVAPAVAGTNGLDPRFGVGGVMLLGPTPTSGQVMGPILALAFQGDGKIVVAGRADSGTGAVVPAVGRLNSNGTWDTSFGDHGVFVVPLTDASASLGGRLLTIGLMSDGSILASGGTYSDNFSDFNSCTLILKLTIAGALDPDFANGGSFCYDFGPPDNTYIGHYDGIAIDSDDTWYLTAISTNLGHGAVAHFDTAGTLLTSYGVGGVASLPDGLLASRISLQPDHSLLVAGIHHTSGGDSIGASHVAAGGIVDSTFGVAGEFQQDFETNGFQDPESMAVDAQGRLLIADNGFTGATDYFPYRFVRATAAGIADTSFNSNGQQPGYPGLAAPVVSGDSSIDLLVGAQPLADGHIFAVGDAGPADSSFVRPTNIALLRLNNDSSYDASFGDATHPGWAAVNIGVAGTSTTIANALALDTSGRAFVSFVGTDAIGNFCTGIIRAIPDQLFADSLDPVPLAPTCPQ